MIKLKGYLFLIKAEFYLASLVLRIFYLPIIVVISFAQPGVVSERRDPMLEKTTKYFFDLVYAFQKMIALTA